VAGDGLFHNVPFFLLIQRVRGGVVNIKDYLLKSMLDQVCSQQVIMFFHDSIFADIQMVPYHCEVGRADLDQHLRYSSLFLYSLAM
jgi:hypothetical protein